jgi:hypothetical protein
MVDLSEECLEVLNGGHFTVVEPGPLHAPIQRFSIRRDEKLRWSWRLKSRPTRLLRQ